MTPIKNKIRDENNKWIDSSVFRQEAIRFMTTGRYCAELPGTPAYMEYWNEQLERCKNGYSVKGHKITGNHYSYLNFSQIQVVVQAKGTRAAKKTTRCPDFWDGDYDYYWAMEIAENGLFTERAQATTKEEKERYLTLSEEEQKEEKQRVLKRLGLRVIPHPEYLDGGNHLIVGKSRRKGYSFKNADVCKNTYNTVRNSLCIIGAFDKKYLYPRGTMGMASTFLNFINKHTAWTKAMEKVNKQDHKRASFEETIGGVKIEAGYLSEIIAITFKDNPDAARGKDAIKVLFEEAGEFPNLKAAFNATAPGLTAGKYITGQILIFGTGGDMGSGTVDFADMFYNPIQYRLMPFVNIWDENATNSYCGFFHPVYWNMEGYYDEQGNSDVAGAKAAELKERDRIVKNSTSSNVIQSRVQEFSMSPSEAFLTVSTNDFPIIELRQQYNKVVREKLHIISGQPCWLTKEKEEGTTSNMSVEADGEIRQKYLYTSGVKINMDLRGELEPLWSYKVKTDNLKGAVVIFEPPVPNPPKGLYKIGFDPYRQVNGESLAAIYVYKTVRKGDPARNYIVAQYVGRPYSPDEVNRIAEMLAELYNTEIMHENEVTHVKGYFEKRKKLHLLAAQPDAVISANIKESVVSRVYGIHMVEKLKDAGEKYIKEWLLTVRGYDSENNVILNLHTIKDPGLLEELILYNRKGNFDRVMAFMMIMFQIEEDYEAEYASEEQGTTNEEDLLNLLKKQFRR